MFKGVLCIFSLPHVKQGPTQMVVSVCVIGVFMNDLLAQLCRYRGIALELRLNVEKRFNVDLPLIAMSDQTTLITIATPIVARIVDGSGEMDTEGLTSAEDALMQRHVSEDISAADILDIKSVIDHQSAPKRVTV